MQTEQRESRRDLGIIPIKAFKWTNYSLAQSILSQIEGTFPRVRFINY